MLSIIIVRNRASDLAMARTIEAAQSTGLSHISVISDLAVPGMRTITKSFTPSILADEMKSSGSQRTILVDARLAPSNSQFQTGIGALSRGHASPINYIPMRRNGKQIDISAMKSAQLVDFLAGSPEWPVMMVGIDRSMISSIESMQANSTTELVASMMAICSVNDQVVAAAGSAMELGSSFDKDSTLALSGTGISTVLKNMMSLCNIEDMFPNHPWDHHEAEAGAAAYHSMAALFVRCGDLESAQTCLNLSDNLEDSPRSLALRAFIAEQKGELLGAVANMVASLQGYEERKSNDGSHYLTFSPLNVEVVSSDLKQGLEALNNSNNEQAYRYFSKAVIAFDPLFKSAGFGR